jgi:hypothetical protein
MYEDIEVLRRLLNSKLQAEYPPARQFLEAMRREDCASCHSSVHQWPDSYRRRLIGHPGSTLQLNNGTVNTFVTPSQLLNDGTVNTFVTPPQSNQLVPSDDFFRLSPWVDIGQNRNVWLFSDADTVFKYSTSPHWLVLDRSLSLAERLLDIEGVYLKGQGVVYTLTLPPPPQPKADAPKAAPRPVSDWDRVRRELRNEKSEPEQKEHPRKEPTLADTILQVLMDNGHHFAQLGENESLTVVVTFRGQDPPAAAANTPKAGADPNSQEQAAPAANTNAAGDPAAPSSAQDYQLLGDLHLKQGRVDEAIRAYRQAVDQGRDPKGQAAVLRKLAQALITLGKDAEAEQALEQAMAQVAKPAPTHGRAAEPAATPRSPLPAKLIITVPKKLLDQAADGKMPLEEFRKGTTVESIPGAPPHD